MLPTTKLIVADDDPAMRRWLRIVLERLGATVCEAESGSEILSLLAAERDVDLIVTDVRMPMPDGLSVLAIVRTAGLATPVVLITAFADEAIRRKAETMHAFVLDKPFSAADLERAVTACVAVR